MSNGSAGALVREQSVVKVTTRWVMANETDGSFVAMAFACARLARLGGGNTSELLSRMGACHELQLHDVTFLRASLDGVQTGEYCS